MKLRRRGLAVFGFIVCFQAMHWACSSRLPSPAAPVPPDADRPSESTHAPATPEPPPVVTAPDPGSGSSECVLIAGPGEPITTVALADPVDSSNAPHPTTDSERLLFRQLYETLVRLDCNGRVRPGLAASWQLDASGRTWIVTLREGARFSDGALVTAADVRASWTRHGKEDELLPRVSHLIQSITLAGDRAIAITLRHQRGDVPAALAHSDLAIAKAVTDSPWPLGTRSRRIAAGHAAAARAVVVETVAPDVQSTIRFLAAPTDLRDLLDTGVDLLLTRDPATLEYAATLPAFQSVALPWHRVHVLLTPGRSPSSPVPAEDARQLLANDAVRGEAQGARGPFWWRMVPDCEARFPPARGPSVRSPRIVYDAGDAASRDLAERFVGLMRASGPPATALLDALFPDRSKQAYTRATGLSGDALASARRRGTDAGYVIPLHGRPIEPCRDLQVLMERMPWLDPDAIVPLVETRRHAIVRRGRSGVMAEWDGGLLITGVNDSR